ncbi:Invertase [Wickerhamomyces ciferrii]|uniref:Invertase n=1 Tax=Wickerhamomyces ciferrii (strain ATCC 14091 / BCRC 22168 / CBS 111 / JCM 3599 / NBRC 0793 / NRRL Y-1031 F-60-10) TaxID=1206466 RepID=K0KDY2_WICCF|nr:Invertase [Wickerhamomyces ciferrii]CCH43290.1 Invertase [Wickerhamomyces ciferrii]
MITKIFSIFLLFSLVIAADKNYNRPQFHLTPEKGWMNDPNGLWYDQKDKIWHAYYQHNPNSTVFASPISWGHSTSKDLIKWDYHGVAVKADNKDEDIFSGSIVIDKNNTSGFFNDDVDPEQRVVMVYTSNFPGAQTQAIGYSTDGGYTFIKYDGNPVINTHSSSQRDPKMFWHEESEKWIMVVVDAQVYNYQIYSSSDLKKWEQVSTFQKKGYLGGQYECPGLIKVPIENPDDGQPDYKWVLYLSINPGSPIGGSAVEYFIGDFDGETFTPDDGASRFMDFGKDFYALQTFDNTRDEDGVVGLAWASNWQYSSYVPTDGWRSSTSMVRRFTLRNVKLNPSETGLNLIQTPVWETEDTLDDGSLKNWYMINEYDVEDTILNKWSKVETDFNSETNSSGVLEFNLTFAITDFSAGLQDGPHTLAVNILSQEVDGSKDKFQLVFDLLGRSWYLDRGNGNAFQRDTPVFDERLSFYHESQQTGDKGPLYNIYGIVDRNVLELFVEYGQYALTNTFFFDNGRIPTSIEVVSNYEQSFATIQSFVARELALK